MKLCKAKSVTQKKLCGTVLLSIAPQYDITGDDGAVSDLLLCKKGLSSYVTDAAPTVTARTISDYFRQYILPMLDENKRESAVLSLKDIISEDDTIKSGTTIDRVSGHTKADILGAISFVLEDLLAGLFLYTVSFVDNKSGKSSIGSINSDYIESFASRTSEISVISTSDAAKTALVNTLREGPTDMEAAAEIADGLMDRLLPIIKPDNSLLITLLSESNGNCLRCGNILGISKKGAVPASNCQIVHLTKTVDEPTGYENAVALCNSCVPFLARMTNTEKDTLLVNKRQLAANMIVLDEVSVIKIANEIESVLREIDKVKNATELAAVDITELVSIERKISELYLRNKINASMVRLFKTVNDICARLEQEVGFDTERFGRNMKYALETIEDEIKDRADITDPQEYITDTLIRKLYTRVGQRYQAACEIVVAYLVKRCDLFHENAK